MSDSEKFTGPSFEQAFTDLATLAADHSKICEVRAIAPPPEATELLPRIEIYSRRRFRDERPSDDFIQEGTTYRHWYQPPRRSRDRPERISAEEIGAQRYAARATWNFRRLTPAVVAGIFTPYTQQSDQLSHVIRYISGAAEDKLTSDLTTATHDTVVRSLRFTDDEAGFRQIVEAFTGEPAAAYKRVQVSTALGKLLLGNQVGSHPRQKVEKLVKRELHDAILAYDRADLLDYNGFWVKFGVVATGVAKMPSLLPVLYDKVKDRGTPFEKSPSAPLYITEVLLAASDDPLRRRDQVRRIIENCRSIQFMSGVALSARSIIEESNAVAHIYNRVVGDESLRMSMLDPHNPAHLSDAFLRLMGTTRQKNLSAEQHIAQVEQDILHAEIVALITQGTQGRMAMEMGDLSLQLPGATRGQLEGIRRLAEATGLSLPEALRRSLRREKE